LPQVWVYTGRAGYSAWMASTNRRSAGTTNWRYISGEMKPPPAKADEIRTASTPAAAWASPQAMLASASRSRMADARPASMISSISAFW